MKVGKFTIIVAVMLAMMISLASCSNQSENQYVQFAKKYDYWYGFGGVSWGMSIDECIRTLGGLAKKVDRMGMLYNDDYGETHRVVIELDVLGKGASAAFDFTMLKDKKGGVFANSEWLTEIKIIFNEQQDAGEIIPALKAELKSIGLLYTEKNGYENPKLITEIKGGDKAMEFWNNTVIDVVDDDADIAGQFVDAKLDSMTVEVYDSNTIAWMTFNGRNAAILAKYEQSQQ